MGMNLINYCVSLNAQRSPNRLLLHKSYVSKLIGHFAALT